VHSPVGGQGMNTGLQDAYNLAWKLALVVQGRAGDALLESYEAERRRVAQNLLRTTDRAFTQLVSQGWLGALVRTRIAANAVAIAMRFARVREAAFRTISQIGIRYPESMLSAPASATHRGPSPGDRFPWLRLRFGAGLPAQDLFERLDDTRFNLIVIGQPAPAPASGPEQALALHVVADDPANNPVLSGAGIDKLSFYLLRPDGYVGLAGGRLLPGEISRYFAERAIHLEPREGATSNTPTVT
jgi:hypothetical protein